jgi:hypothetical protein
VIDVAISGEQNVIKKETERVIKQNDITVEIQRKWMANKKKVMPAISGETGTCCTSFRLYLSDTRRRKKPRNC